MNKIEWLDRSLLLCPYFCLCLNEKQFGKVLKQLNIQKKNWPDFLSMPHAHATVHFFEKSDGSLCCVVTFGDYKNSSFEAICGLLTHEAVHIWQQYKQFIGESEPSKEFEAYSIQWISQSLIKSFIKQSGAKIVF